jgi:hypothetical protein
MSGWAKRRVGMAGIAGSVVLVAALVAGCSGQSSGSSSTPAPVTVQPAAGSSGSQAVGSSGSKVVLASVRTTAAATSARVALTVSAGAAAGSSFSLTADGVTDFATGNSQFTAQLGGEAASLLQGPLEERVVDGTVYVQLPASILGLLGGSGGSKWFSFSSSGLGGAASPVPGLGEADPSQFLAYLETVSDNVKNVGSESIRGVETTHYHATLDLGKAIDKAQVPQSLRDSLQQVLAQSGAQAPVIPVDVFVDAGGRLRRVSMTLSAATVTLDLYDFGVPVNVQAPPADQIVQFPSLGALSGGLGTSSSTS